MTSVWRQRLPGHGGTLQDLSSLCFTQVLVGQLDIHCFQHRSQWVAEEQQLISCGLGRSRHPCLGNLTLPPKSKDMALHQWIDVSARLLYHSLAWKAGASADGHFFGDSLSLNQPDFSRGGRHWLLDKSIHVRRLLSKSFMAGLHGPAVNGHVNFLILIEI